MKAYKSLIVVCLLIAGSVLFDQCKKDTVTETVTVHDTVYLDPNDTGIFVPSNAIIDTTWTYDKVHCSVMWESKFYDFSSTVLTGRFNNFGFNPKFNFNETNLASNSADFWVQLSTFNTGEPGRDGYGKCGTTYLGVTYLDSLKTLVDPLSDTAKFHLVSTTVTNDGYVMNGTFTFNRYRTPSGQADGTPITKNINVSISYNGQRDFDSDANGVYDKLRAGFTVTFSFNRSDFMDNTSTKAWDLFSPLDPLTVNNKTYGVWSTSVADKMDITLNAVYYKNH
ncbi:MAG: YceI family protein [Bacteroidia bacterium]